MNPLVRFWVVVLSLTTSVAALGYLSLSFLSPESDLVLVGPAVRLALAILAVGAISVFVWSTVLKGEDTSEMLPNKG